LSVWSRWCQKYPIETLADLRVRLEARLIASSNVAAGVRSTYCDRHSHLSPVATVNPSVVRYVSPTLFRSGHATPRTTAVVLVVLLSDVGPFDQFMVRGSWANLGVERFVCSDSTAIPALAQVVLLERTVTAGDRIPMQLNA
jgi:hypothetical protein